MAVTEAQKRASAKYQREKVKRISTSFYPDDSDIWDHLNNQTNKQGYIKQLIREDMERRASK